MDIDKQIEEWREGLASVKLGVLEKGMLIDALIADRERLQKLADDSIWKHIRLIQDDNIGKYEIIVRLEEDYKEITRLKKQLERAKEELRRYCNFEIEAGSECYARQALKEIEE